MTPTTDPSDQPTSNPSEYPTRDPTREPSHHPTMDPSKEPTMLPTVDPSKEPTADPTSDPTRHPTLEPTDEPTTVDPTSPPTSNPSAQPTEQPTNDPSVEPTGQPTRQPSADPTGGPTPDPTQSPSLEPTQRPTSNPSSSPTLCVYAQTDNAEHRADAYLNQNAAANDQRILDEINALKARMNEQIANEPSLIIVEDDENRLEGYVVQCDIRDDTEICFIHCKDRYWCRGTIVEIEDGERTAHLSEVAMICEGSHACDVSVDIHSSSVERFTLLCNGEFACESVIVSIVNDHWRDVDITILCGGDGDDEAEGDDAVWSCLEMDVSVHIQSGNVTIGCYDSAACDSLSVSVDSEAVRLSVEMFEFSENVQLSHPNHEMVDIECSADDAHRFVEIDPAQFASLPVQRQMAMARAVYAADKLPCEGVEVACESDTLGGSGSEQSCEMQYEATQAFLEELELLDQTICYWYDVTAIIEPHSNCDACSATLSADTSRALLSDINDLILAVIAVAVVAILIWTFAIHRLCRKHQKRVAIAKQTLSVKNPMVLAVGIARYEKKPTAPDFPGYVPDLVGLELDIKNTLRLFLTRLRYACFPHYDLKAPKLSWTKAELEALLEERAAVFEANLRSDSAEKFDGLICVVSCHGMKDQIITSDYKLLKTVEFHRFFSKGGHAMSRTVPRIFIFDCCHGNGEYGKFVSLGKNKLSTDDEGMLADMIDANSNPSEGGAPNVIAAPNEHGKNADDTEEDSEQKAAENESESEDESEDEFEEEVEEEKVAECSVSSEAMWALDTEHPDHQLAVLNASTWGFQSKLNVESGSYLIAGFVDRAEKQLKAKGCVPRIGALFKEIQDELRERNKQLPIYIWNGNTENITFYPRGADIAAVEQSTAAMPSPMEGEEQV